MKHLLDDCISELQAIIKKYAEGELKPEALYDIISGSILINKESGKIFVACSSNNSAFMHDKDPFVLACLSNSGRWSPPRLKSEILDEDFRTMRSGTITVTVKDGKVFRAAVKED